MYNGTTYYKPSGNPFEQLVHIDDWPQRDSIHQMNFTTYELCSNNGTFCKGISNTISSKATLHTFEIINILVLIKFFSNF